jgi:hypothetical protein
MKTTLLALLFLCATAAFAQSSAGYSTVLSSEPRMLEIPTHNLHASQHPLAQEQNIMFISSNVYAHGERPLWEVGAKPAPEVPLGDVARFYRGEHATAKKAVKVLEQ